MKLTYLFLLLNIISFSALSQLKIGDALPGTAISLTEIGRAHV